jgi:hypothetical protein
MNILLFSMPDSFEHMPTIAIRMPNGALTSLAGNVDPHHQVAAADLLLVQNRVRETVERLVAEHEPEIVGLSVMTFQRKTAKGIINLVRTRRPGARIASSVAMIRASLPRPTPRTLTAGSISSCGARARSRFVSCCARSRHSADMRTPYKRECSPQYFCGFGELFLPHCLRIAGLRNSNGSADSGQEPGSRASEGLGRTFRR